MPAMWRCACGCFTTPAFTAAPQPRSTVQAQTVHQQRRLVDSAPLANLQLAAAPAMVSSRPAHSSVAYKITLEMPDGVKELECPDDAYLLDTAEKEEVRSHRRAEVPACGGRGGDIFRAGSTCGRRVTLFFLLLLP